MAPPEHSPTRRIAEFVSRIELKNIPPPVRELAELHVIDGLATMLGGAGEESSRLLRRHLPALRSRGSATVIGARTRLAAEHAALVNGVQAHVLDYDDAQLTTDPARPMGQQSHPTSPVLSAALAVAETCRASGADLLVAYIAGVEVACRLGDAINPSHYLAGLHPTGTLGVFGAAAACARLLKLERSAIQQALGIAGTLASGLRANRGTMAKGLNAGNAARNGVLAASLAARGFTASDKIFEIPMGFFEALCPAGVDRALLRFGTPFFFDKPGVAIKLYPCAGVLHPALDAVLALRARQGIRPEAVARITVTLDSRAALPLVYNDPQDPLQAKFSLPFAVAVALADGAAGPKQFSAGRLRNARIRALMRRVDGALSANSRDAGIDTAVEIRMKSGAVHRARASIARGHPSRPAARAEIEEKFRQSAADILPPASIERFLRNVPRLRRARSLAGWLRPLGRFPKR